jgi:hypothetical protein
LCCEIDAHSLILIILKLKQSGEDHLFKPWLWDSQTCEAFFRAARSATPMGSTRTNFTALDFYESRNRMYDALFELASYGEDDGIVYQKSLRKWNYSQTQRSDEDNDFPLPSISEIEAEVLKAMVDAEAELKLLGMSTFCVVFG